MDHDETNCGSKQKGAYTQEQGQWLVWSEIYLELSPLLSTVSGDNILVISELHSESVSSAGAQPTYAEFDPSEGLHHHWWLSKKSLGILHSEWCLQDLNHWLITLVAILLADFQDLWWFGLSQSVVALHCISGTASKVHGSACRENGSGEKVEVGPVGYALWQAPVLEVVCCCPDTIRKLLVIVLCNLEYWE